MKDELKLSNDKIESLLNEKAKIWETMQAKRAEEYYYDEIFPLVVNKFHLSINNEFYGKYENLILSLGMSFEPLVLTIKALKPKRVLFLYTEDSLKNLDEVIKWTNLLPSQYVAEEIVKDDPVDIYRVLKKVYVDRWGSPVKTAIDFTGGTKSMSAGIAMAGAYFKIDLIYVASEYNSKMRKPKPGTEELKFVEDPYHVFGDLEKDKAIALFNKNEFVSAYNIFSDLEERVADRDYIFYKLLSNIYRLWDCLYFNECIKEFEKLFSILKAWRYVEKDLAAYKYYETLYNQYRLIKPLESINLNDKNEEWEYITNKELYIPLMFSIYTNALRRSEEGKNDVAILLLYRVLELIAQVRLAKNGFNVSLPDYSVFNIDKHELLSRMNENIKHFKNFKTYAELPNNSIALFDAYVILKAIEDELMEGINIGMIYSNVKLRNKSIFAHGFGILSNNDFDKFHEIVRKIFIRFCDLENINFESICGNYKFILLS
ncbi:TIGR02710 family CRISPR-associated CARF protein [Thermoanaerobacterium thermosaccharolyticum]|uniref:TIGR02710 family CRISPR-associated CARF protein n=1 Tax=Thermoanaerobacterium thermosaccharolyticum TaxID=1517 RepID=UPI003D2A3C55